MNNLCVDIMDQLSKKEELKNLYSETNKYNEHLDTCSTSSHNHKGDIPETATIKTGLPLSDHEEETEYQAHATEIAGRPHHLSKLPLSNIPQLLRANDPRLPKTLQQRELRVQSRSLSWPTYHLSILPSVLTYISHHPPDIQSFITNKEHQYTISNLRTTTTPFTANFTLEYSSKLTEKGHSVFVSNKRTDNNNEINVHQSVSSAAPYQEESKMPNEIHPSQKLEQSLNIFRAPNTCDASDCSISQTNDAGITNTGNHASPEKRYCQCLCMQKSQNDQSTICKVKSLLRELLSPNNIRILSDFIGESSLVNNLNDVQEASETEPKESKKTSSEVEKNNVPETLNDNPNIENDVVLEKQKRKTRFQNVEFIRSTRYLRGREISQGCQPDLASIVDQTRETINVSDEPPTKRAKQSELIVGNKSLEKVNQAIKNNNPEWHSSNKEMHCQVCDKPQGRSLVSHYVNVHPTIEVHTSRLMPEVAKLILASDFSSECEVIQAQGTSEQKIRQFCYFCNAYKCYSRLVWIDHMAVHTGYYQYKCIDCSRKFAVKNRSHACNEKNNLEEIPQPHFHEENLMAYICHICNYVRFDEAEIKKHLSCEHDENVVKSFKKKIFLRLPTKKNKKVEEILTSDSDTNNDDTQQNLEEPHHYTSKVKLVRKRNLRSTQISSDLEPIPEFCTDSSTAENNKKIKSITASDESLKEESKEKRSFNEIDDEPNSTLKKPKKESSVPQLIIKNNNPEWYSMKTETQCQMCDKVLKKNLVNHYVNVHPNSEVLTSRLAPDVANSLRNSNENYKYEILRPDGTIKCANYLLRQFCYFCNEQKSLTRWIWIDHIVGHTGYFQYKCNDCKRKFVRRSVYHVCKEKNNMEMIPQPQFRDENLYAYLCDLCNYVRFHESEMKNHLKCEHEENTINMFKKVFFLRLSTKNKKEGIVNHVEENEIDKGDSPQTMDAKEEEKEPTSSSSSSTSSGESSVVHIDTSDSSSVSTEGSNSQEQFTNYDDDSDDWESISDNDSDIMQKKDCESSSKMSDTIMDEVVSNTKKHHFNYNLYEQSKSRHNRDKSDRSPHKNKSRNHLEQKDHDRYRGSNRDSGTSEKKSFQHTDSNSRRSSGTSFNKKNEYRSSSLSHRKSGDKNGEKYLPSTHRKHDQRHLDDSAKNYYRYGKGSSIDDYDLEIEKQSNENISKRTARLNQLSHRSQSNGPQIIRATKDVRMEAPNKEQPQRIHAISTPRSESSRRLHYPPEVRSYQNYQKFYPESGLPSTNVRSSANLAVGQSSNRLHQSALQTHQTLQIVPKVPARYSFQTTPKMQKEIPSSFELQGHAESNQDIANNRESQIPLQQTSHSHDSVDDTCTKRSTYEFLKEFLNPTNLRALANLMSKLPAINSITEVQKILEEQTQSKELATYAAVEGNCDAKTPTEHQKNEVEKSSDDADTVLSCDDPINKDHVVVRREETKTTSLKVQPSSTLSRVATPQECQSDLSAVVSTIDELKNIGYAEQPAKRLKRSLNASNSLENVIPRIRNNNPKYHSLMKNIQCPICDKSTRYAVNHFVNDHPNSEVITSRLPTHVANYLRKSKNILKCERVVTPETEKSKAFHKYAQFCYFCNEIKSLKRDHWVTHMARHTGDYRFKCTGCCKKFADRQHNSCNKKFVEIPQPQFRSENLMAYICDLCNFVRFNEKEIRKHLHSEHESNATKNFKKVIFLRFPMIGKKHEMDNGNEVNENGLDTNDESHEAEINANVANIFTNGRVQSAQKRMLNLTENGETPESKKPKMVSVMSKSLVKNNNPNWHSLNTEVQCQICDKPVSRNLINHYVNDHPKNEVLTSRLGSDAAKSLRNSIHNLKYEQSQLQRKGKVKADQKLRQFCYFCNQYKSYVQWFWIDHMVKHTGYYHYECRDCSKKFSRNNIHHVCKEKNNIRKIPQPQFRNVNLMAYVCNLCQYVRFKETEIEQHLICEHGNNVRKEFKEFIFLRLPLNKTVEDGSHSHESENDADIIDNTQQTTTVETQRATEAEATSSTALRSVVSSAVSIQDGDSTANSTRGREIILGKGENVKTLIVFQSGVHSFTFTLKDSGTVQELLKLNGVPFTDHTNIECFTNPVVGIDLLVTVGVTCSGGPSVIISKAQKLLQTKQM